MATIYDAVEVSAIPSSATVCLAYVDGAYVTTGAVRDRFPSARILTVTTSGRSAADICDVESGDATPAAAAAWVRAGLGKVVYCATSNYVAVAAECEGLDWQWFAADWTGHPHIVAGSVATQWGAPGFGASGNYDVSDALDSWLNPTPAPSPIPDPPEVDTMTGLSPSITAGRSEHRSSVFLGALGHYWRNPAIGVWGSENVAHVAGTQANNAAVAALTFDADQVPTVEIVGNQLVIAAVATSGHLFEFRQTIGTAGWGADQIL